MNPAAKSSVVPRGFPRLAAAFCLGLFVLLQVFAASAPLHQRIHADAAAPGHECVLTLLAQGQVTLFPPGVGLVVSFGLLLWRVPIVFQASVSVSNRLAPTRGPPVV